MNQNWWYLLEGKQKEIRLVITLESRFNYLNGSLLRFAPFAPPAFSILPRLASFPFSREFSNRDEKTMSRGVGRSVGWIASSTFSSNLGRFTRIYTVLFLFELPLLPIALET